MRLVLDTNVVASALLWVSARSSIGQMPRAKQKFITEMLEALIRQQKAS